LADGGAFAFEVGDLLLHCPEIRIERGSLLEIFGVEGGC